MSTLLSDPAPEEALAQRFHETYERLAPHYGYKPRDESAVPWENVPEQNRALMVATCRLILHDVAAHVARVMRDADDRRPCPHCGKTRRETA